MSVAPFVPPPAEPLPPPRLLEVAQVARRLSVGQEHVRVLIRRRELPHIKFGRRYRVDPIELQTFIDAHQVRSVSSTDKFCCPNCGAWTSKVVDSRPDTQGSRYVRWRRCTRCGQLFETIEELTGRTSAMPPGRPIGVPSSA